MFEKLSLYRNQIIWSLLAILLSTIVFATPPGSPYTPNQTLDPSCAPWDINCIVELSFLTWELDPIYTSSPAYSIGTGAINQWNSAYLWGNHASWAYLTWGSVNTLAKSSLSCSSGQIPSYSGSLWICSNPWSWADNLGSHLATQNINLNGNWLSGNGINQGIFVSTGGLVWIGKSNPLQGLDNAWYYRSTVNGGDVYMWNLSSTQSILTASTWLDMVLGTGFSPVITIKPTGNIGIGTTTPSSFLHLSSTTAGPNLLRLTRNSLDANVYTTYQNDATNWSEWIFGWNYDNYLILNAANQAVLSLTQDGRMGIGTNDPTVGSKLHINGTEVLMTSAVSSIIRFATSGSLLTNGYIRSNIGTGGTEISAFATWAFLSFSVSGTNERMRVTSTGSVGIGNPNPATRLNVRDGPITVDDTAGTNYLYMWKYASGSSIVRVDVGQDLFLWNTLSPFISIKSWGNVGIGTITPKSTLEVNGIIATGVQTITSTATIITKSYVTLTGGDAILPRAQDNPWAFIFIRNSNNSWVINVTIASWGWQFFDASSSSWFATYGMNGAATGKSLILVSDWSNWTVFRPAN
jgi:hypothetical protein